MSASDTDLARAARRHGGPLLGLAGAVAAVLVLFLASVDGLVAHAQPVRDTGPLMNDETGRPIRQGPPALVAPQPTLPQVPADRGYGQQGYGETPAQLARALGRPVSAPV